MELKTVKKVKHATPYGDNENRTKRNGMGVPKVLGSPHARNGESFGRADLCGTTIQTAL